MKRQKRAEEGVTSVPPSSLNCRRVETFFVLEAFLSFFFITMRSAEID